MSFDSRFITCNSYHAESFNLSGAFFGILIAFSQAELIGNELGASLGMDFLMVVGNNDLIGQYNCSYVISVLIFNMAELRKNWGTFRMKENYFGAILGIVILILWVTLWLFPRLQELIPHL